MTFNQEYGRYCLVDTTDDLFDVIFINNGNAVARRSFIGYSTLYINDAIDNWNDGISKIEHFTMEERLRA